MSDLEKYINKRKVEDKVFEEGYDDGYKEGVRLSRILFNSRKKKDFYLSDKVF